MASLALQEIQLLAQKDATKLKLELFKLAKRLQEEHFLEEFISQGGTDILLRTVQKEQGNVASYAMKALLHIFEADQTLSNISANQVMFQRLFELSYSSQGTVARNAVGLLAVFCEYAEDGFNLVDTGAQQALCSHPDIHPYKQAIILLNDRDVKTQKEAANLLRVMLTKSVSVGRLQDFVHQLLKLQLADALGDMEAKTPSQDIKQIVQDIRLACNIRLEGPSTAESELSKEIQKAFHSFAQQQWRVTSVNAALGQQFGGEQLSGRVRAIHGISAIAGESKPETELVKTLQLYLQKMEKSVSELTAEKAEVEGKRKKELEESEKRQNLQFQQLAEQQRKLEDTLKKLEQSAEETAKKKASSESGSDVKLLQDQIVQLQQNQKLLMKDFEEQQEITAQRSYLQQHNQLWTFYQIVQMKLNELFLASKALASGLVQGELKTQRSRVHCVIQLAGEAIPLPGAKLASTLINGTINYFVQRKSQRKAELTSGLAITVSAMEKLSEESARLLAFRFEEQLRCLSSRGVKVFSECAVRRMLEAMRAGLVTYDATNYHDSLESQTLVHRLVDATVNVEAKQGALKIKNKKIETRQKELNWTEAGIFTKTGIRTLDDRYYDGKQTRPEKYGYRLGEHHHISQMSLIEAPCRAKSLVGSAPTLSPIKKRALETKSRQSAIEMSLESRSSTLDGSSSTVSEDVSKKLTSQPSYSVLEAKKQESVKTVRRGSDPALAIQIPKTQNQSKKPALPRRPTPPFSPRNSAPKSTKKQASLVPSGRRGSVPLLEAQKCIPATGKSPVRSKSAHVLSAHRRKLKQVSTRELPPLPRRKPVQSQGDKVWVDRALLEHYEQRLVTLESKLEELSTIKSQMQEMQAMMRSLLLLNPGNPGASIERIGCSSPVSPHPPLPPLPSLPHFSLSKAGTPPQPPRRLAV